MGLGVLILSWYSPSWRRLAKLCQENILLFQWENFQMSSLAALMVTIVAGLLGVFLIIQNLSYR